MSRVGTVRSHLGEAEEEQIEQMLEVSAELHEHGQWGLKTMHYDHYTGESLDEDLCQGSRRRGADHEGLWGLREGGDVDGDRRRAFRRLPPSPTWRKAESGGGS
eukprot:3300068-Pyramimonas_sp.AAC.1